MKDLIRRRLVFIDSEHTMAAVVRIMRDENISSVLVLNKERRVVGIVTERDIVQKFTLLEHSDKMNAPVSAFMTRPVLCARLGSLDADVRDMFFQKHLRHFPVTDGEMHESNIVGMLTVTDVSGAFLRSNKPRRLDLKAEPLVIIAQEDSSRNRYKTLFESLQYMPIIGVESKKLIKQACDYGFPVVYDIDGMGFEDVKQDLLKLQSHRGVFIILSSQPELVEPLRAVLNQQRQFVALKPLDISYLLLLLNSMHKEESKASPSNAS